MISRSSWLPLLLAVTAVLSPIGARAQDGNPGRIQDELDVTDRRIEFADALVEDGASTPAGGELALARQIQSRARSAFSAGQYAAAHRSTLEARAHADRAIAIVRGLPDPDRVQMQVERTGELAERARERLAECQEPRAKALLRISLEMQTRAEAALRESRYLAALQLTMSARERLFKAMRLCKVAEALGESAAHALQRTEEILSRARETVDAGGSPEDRRALDRAVALQTEAESKYRAEQYEAAIRMTQNARHIAQRVVKGRPPSAPGGAPGRR